MKRMMPLIAILSISTLGLTNCKSKSEEDESMLLGLAVLSNNSSNNSALTTEQQQASSAANSAASISANVSASANAGGNTAMHLNRHQKLASLYEEITMNGKDPYFIRKKLSEIETGTESARNKAELAAIAFSNNGTTNGHNSYTFSGTTGGSSVTKTTVDVSAHNPYITDTCLLDFYNIDNTANIGTATITNGIMTFSGTGSGASFSGTTTQSYTTTFNNFGTAWMDNYSFMKAIKDGGLSWILSVPADQMTCSIFQQTYNVMFSYMRSGIINSGSMDVEYTMDYSNSPSVGVSSTYSTRLISTEGIVLDGTNITMDLTITNSSNYSSSGAAYVGSISIAYSGTVNGQSVNDTLTIAVP